MSGSKPRPGFTFVEMVIVMIIIGILASLTVPSFVRSLSYHRVESAAKRIKADLALARDYAMATSSRQTVSFVVAFNRYSLDGVPDLNRSSEVYEVDLSESPFGVAIVSAEFADSADTDLEFNGYGIPDSDATIVIESGGYQRTIVVDRETGEASIQ